MSDSDQDIDFKAKLATSRGGEIWLVTLPDDPQRLRVLKLRKYYPDAHIEVPFLEHLRDVTVDFPIPPSLGGGRYQADRIVLPVISEGTLETNTTYFISETPTPVECRPEDDAKRIRELYKSKVMTLDSFSAEDEQEEARHVYITALLFERIQAESIYHNDIKPQNILLADDRIFIIDFQCATWKGRQTRISRPDGTPIYMSPERLSAALRVDTGNIPGSGEAIAENFTSELLRTWGTSEKVDGLSDGAALESLIEQLHQKLEEDQVPIPNAQSEGFSFNMTAAEYLDGYHPFGASMRKWVALFRWSGLDTHYFCALALSLDYMRIQKSYWSSHRFLHQELLRTRAPISAVRERYWELDREEREEAHLITTCGLLALVALAVLGYLIIALLISLFL